MRGDEHEDYVRNHLSVVARWYVEQLEKKTGSKESKQKKLLLVPQKTVETHGVGNTEAE